MGLMSICLSCLVSIQEEVKGMVYRQTLVKPFLSFTTIKKPFDILIAFI